MRFFLIEVYFTKPYFILLILLGPVNRLNVKIKATNLEYWRGLKKKKHVKKQYYKNSEISFNPLTEKKKDISWLKYHSQP